MDRNIVTACTEVPQLKQLAVFASTYQSQWQAVPSHANARVEWTGPDTLTSCADKMDSHSSKEGEGV